MATRLVGVDTDDPRLPDVVIDASIGISTGTLADGGIVAHLTETRFAQYDIRDYGAKVDGRELLDVAMTAASATLDSTGYTFTSADIGKVIGVAGAGTISTDYSTNANDGVLVSTIASVSGGNAVLANVAVNTVSAATCVFGTADDDAISDAQDAAVAAGGGTVFFPPGRTIATRPLAVRDFISWAGVHRDVSWVDVIFSAPGSGAASAGVVDWLSCVAQSEANPLTGASFHDFGINARFHIRPGGYTNPMKVLNIYYVKRCDIQRMNVWNTATTAIPFDHAYESALIAHNVIMNPGRFYTQNTNSSKSGSSGIGIGTLNDGGAEPGLVIGNTIIGVGNASTRPNGNNGIFVEGQSSSDPAQASRGYRIVNNYVQGMTNGIADEGSQGTIIANNIVNKCQIGIRATDGGVGGAFPGIDTTITGNTIIESIEPLGTDPTVRGHAIFVNSNASDDVGIRSHITNNVIVKTAGRGIRVNAGTNDIAELVITGNKIRETQRSAIYISQTTATPATLTAPVISNNDIAEQGLAGVSNDEHGIYIAATIVDPLIQNNRVVGGEGLRVGGTGAITGTGLISGNMFPTVVLDGTIDQTVRVVGNIGWPTLDADAVVWVKPTDFVDILGTTTVGFVGGAPHRAFADAVDTTAAVIVAVPSDWATYTIQVIWTSAVGSSGDVRFRGDVLTFTAGDPINTAPTAGTELTFNTMSDGSPQVRNLKTGVSAADPFCLINLFRNGDYVADTSTNPALVLGLRLIRTA